MKKKRNQLTDIIPVIPGGLICLMILIVLILDIFLPGMENNQYKVFNILFTLLDYVSIACGILLYISMLRNHIGFDLLGKPFSVLLLLIITSTIINGFSKFTIDGIPYRYIGVINTVAFLLIYLGLSKAINSNFSKMIIVCGFILVADLVGVAVLFDIKTSCIAAFHNKKGLSAIFFNSNHYGYFLLMAILIGVGLYMYGEGKEHAFGAASAMLNAFILILNHSMGSILAAVFVIGGMALCVIAKDKERLQRLYVLGGVIAIGLVAALVLSQNLRNELISFSSDIAAVMTGTANGSLGHNRLLLWDLTIRYIKDRPLLGYGCEGIAFMLYEATGRSNPHNELLTYAAYYGVPAAVCYLAGVISIFVGYFKNREHNSASTRAACMAAAGYFISSMTGVAMFYTVPFFFIFLGMTATKNYQ